MTPRLLVPSAARARRVTMWLVAFAMLGPWVAAAPAAALSPDEVASKIKRAHRALDDWQIDEAAALAEELTLALPDIPPVQEIVGLVKFHQGDYPGAVRHLERAAEGGSSPALLELVRSTQKETEGSVSTVSEHFVVRTPKGKDELLAPIAIWALEKAYDSVSTAFDYRPAHRIPVDILHDASGLASVSTLTVKEIETSGTIALCKFNRLMVTSPKALARGYGWLDTLAHEFIHLVISEKSNNQVPIWLHEGLAKYSESLWRGSPGMALGPASENVLAAAVKKKKLITFEQMHPSMAKLPSQHDTALAFAEVFTVIEYMHTLKVGGGKRKGGAALDGFATTNRLLVELSKGRSMDAALRAAVGSDLSRLQKSWKRYLKNRRFKLVPGAEPRKLTFVKNARKRTRSVDEEEEEAALGEAGDRDARRYVRLGNLLYRKGRLRAATVEYAKAIKKIGTRSPVTRNRLAGLYIELGRLEEAKDLLDGTVKAFPDDPQTHVLLGRLALRRKEWAQAATHYRRATWENPFNPEIWAGIYKVSDETKDGKLKAEAEAAIRLLAGHAQQNATGAPFAPRHSDSFGTLSLQSSPWGDVYVDGFALGASTPVVDLRLKAGPHRLRVEAGSSGEVAVQEIDIADGEALRLQLKLLPVSAAERERIRKEDADARAKASRSPKSDKGAEGDGNVDADDGDGGRR